MTAVEQWFQIPWAGQRMQIWYAYLLTASSAANLDGKLQGAPCLGDSGFDTGVLDSHTSSSAACHAGASASHQTVHGADSSELELLYSIDWSSSAPQYGDSHPSRTPKYSSDYAPKVFHWDTSDRLYE